MPYSWKKGLFCGLGIWVLMFVIVSVFVAFKAYDNYASKVILVILSGVVTYYFARYAKADKLTTGFWYGFSWLVVGVVLDWLVTTKFSPDIFRTKSLWAGYAIMFLVAWFGPKGLKSQAPASPVETL